MFQASKIAALEKQVSDIVAQLGAQDYDSAKASLEQILAAQRTHTVTLKEHTDKIALLETEKTELTTQLTTAKQEGADLQKKLSQEETNREALIQEQVTARCAAAGVDPVKRDPDAQDPKGKDVHTPPGNPGAGLKGLAKARAALKAKQDTAKK